jgi:hypothetical protein
MAPSSSTTREASMVWKRAHAPGLRHIPEIKEDSVKR